MKSKPAPLFFILLALGLLTLLAGLLTGPAHFSFDDLSEAVHNPQSKQAMILFELRLPRVLMAIICGASLTLSGFFMQALVRNPLADPYILGLSGGAGFGVNLLILGFVPLAGFSAFTYPLAAVTGGILSLFLLLLLARPSSHEDSFRMILAGIAVSSLFTALTGLLIYLFAEDDQVRKFMFWNFGSFSHSGKEALLPSALALILGFAAGIALAPRLDVLALGEKESHSLGLNSRQMKWLLIVLSSLMVGSAIGFTGPIGFVGMVVPHFSRALLGDLHRKNLLLAPLAGGIFLAVCDLLSQWLYPPAGLPVGVVTALLGLPFFLYLLSKKSPAQSP